MTQPKLTTLTQHEAQLRSEQLDLHSYDLHLDLAQAASEATEYSVSSTLTLRIREPELFLDFMGTQVDGVEVDGAGWDFEFTGSRILLAGLPTGVELRIKVWGRAAYSRTGQGLHRMVDTADGKVYLYSHLEPSDARRIFPCCDQPDLKAVFRTAITAPADWTVLSNQPEVSRETGEQGSVTVHFAPSPVMSTYLTSFAAGPYAVITKQWRDIELRAFARASMQPYLDPELLDITYQGMDFFDAHFGFPYPWGKYDSIFVPEYNLGAMENPGLVTFTESYLHRSAATREQHSRRANTILHEMSHMWFGDLVTPRWWDDLWLKESFAEFMGADASVHATEYTEAWVNFAGVRKNWAYTQDQLPTTHPIKAHIPDVDAARQNFDGITYAKGAAALKQLVHYIGRENFYAGSRDYFQRHAWEAATFEDLIESLQPHTDRDLQAWADAWLKTTGPDTLVPHLRGQDVVGELAIEATSATVLRPHRLNVSLFAQDMTAIATLDVDLPAQQRTVITQAQGLPMPALVVINDGDHTYAKARFDERSVEALKQGLSGLKDPLTRAVVWTNLWQCARDGVIQAADFVDIVVRHAAAEPAAIMTTAFANAQYAVRHFVPQGQREAQLQAYANGVWDLLLQAQPGSDAQLILARAAISVVEPQRLRELQAGAIVTLDPDLTWAILRNLARQDAVTEEELAQAASADQTMSGAANYLGARYAFPGRWEQALQEVLSPGKYSNDEVDALLFAFAQRPYPQLIERAEEIWEAHPMEIANRLIRGLYPEELSAHASVKAPALQRVLDECRDTVERNQRVRKSQTAQ